MSGATSGALAVGSRIPHWPETKGSPKFHARMINGLPRPAMTGNASRAPLCASFRINGTGLISLFIGENPDTTTPGSILIGNGRAAMDSAAAARVAAGIASRNANASWRIWAFRSETDASAAFTACSVTPGHNCPKGRRAFAPSMPGVPPAQKLNIKDVNGATNKVRSRDGRWRIDPGFPTKVGGRHMAEPTSPARDSSLKDR